MKMWDRGTRPEGPARAHPERGPDLAEAHHRLTHPSEMGALFRAMALTGAGWPDPAAFG